MSDNVSPLRLSTMLIFIGQFMGPLGPVQYFSQEMEKLRTLYYNKIFCPKTSKNLSNLEWSQHCLIWIFGQKLTLGIVCFRPKPHLHFLLADHIIAFDSTTFFSCFAAAKFSDLSHQNDHHKKGCYGCIYLTLET